MYYVIWTIWLIGWIISLISWVYFMRKEDITPMLKSSIWLLIFSMLMLLTSAVNLVLG